MSLSRPKQQADTAPPAVWLNPIAQLIKMPIGLSHAGDGSGRVFINLHEGQVLVHDGERLASEPFLDLSELVSCCREQGLLGLAFHPDYENNGRFFVNYTDLAGSTVVAEYAVSDDADIADPASGRTLFTIDRVGDSHNGGDMKFGPDGYLYIGVGDGTPTGAPISTNPAQDPSSPSGKILRIDVDAPAPYVPESNPFAESPDADGRVWAMGLRNPWRLSFDRSTGDLFVGDVGASAWEEINTQPVASKGGENYGWPLIEGHRCISQDRLCEDGRATEPILTHSHDDGWCALIGGYRYQGSRVTDLVGRYLYSDYCVSKVMAATESTSGWMSESVAETKFSVTSLGEDEEGEIYVNDLGNPLGATFRLEPPSASILTSSTDGTGRVRIQTPLGNSRTLAETRAAHGPHLAAAIDRKGNRFIVLGSGTDEPSHVTILDSDGNRIRRWSPFSDQASGVLVAAGDLDGDGKLDVAASMANSAQDNIRVFSADGDQLAEVDPYPGFEGPVHIATGDVTGDGQDELITSPGAGADPIVKIFRISDRSVEQLGEFGAYPSPFTGGVRIAVGDIQPDGTDEIITLPGAGRDPTVNVFRWTSENSASRIRSWLDDAADDGGGWLAAGNLGYPGGAASIVIGDATAPTVRVFSGTGRPLSEFTNPEMTGASIVAVLPVGG